MDTCMNFNYGRLHRKFWPEGVPLFWLLRNLLNDTVYSWGYSIRRQVAVELRIINLQQCGGSVHGLFQGTNTTFHFMND
jgi:hypothetical protein